AEETWHEMVGSSPRLEPVSPEPDGFADLTIPTLEMSRRSPPKPSRSRLPFIVGGAVVALLLVVGGFFLSRAGSKKAETRSAKNPAPEVDPKTKASPKGSDAKAGDTRQVEIAPGVSVAVCWVPAGQCQLGSSKSERDEVEKFFMKEQSWLKDE